MKRITKWVAVCLGCRATIAPGQLYCARCELAHALKAAQQDAPARLAA